jgi:hypothetical protein
VFSLKPVRYKDGDIKHQIANVIRPIAKSWHFQSLKEYNALLTLYNICIEEVRGEINGKPYQGLVYSALNDKGEKVGNPLKSSLFGKSVGIDALEKRIQNSTEIIKNKGLKERSKKIISAAMRTCKNRKDFEKMLEKQGVSVLFRINDEGRIYGATFIDHENKCVFNGSRLGKEFSANVFNDLFKNDKEQDIKPTFEPIENTENMFREKKEDSNIGGIFDLFSPEISGDNHEEEAFIRRMRKK